MSLVSKRVRACICAVFCLCLLLCGCAQKNVGLSAKNSLSTVCADLTGLSSDGGFVKGIYDDGQLKLMSVSIYGEMGNIQKEYSFYDGYMKISVVKEFYREPFYLTPEKVSIDYTEKVQYLIIGEDLYNFEPNDEDMSLLTVSEKDTIVHEMNSYISTLEQAGK